jgi:hypothetical protein
MEVKVGGFVQLYAAPWVGDDSLVENGDPATRPGFRLRRARFGFEGRFGPDVGLLLVVNPLETDEGVGTVSDAKLSFAVGPFLHLYLGTGKVPFSRAALESSRTLQGLERPLSVGLIVPERRLGLTAEGQFLDGRIAYLAGVMNGTEGFQFGNRYGGFLIGGRLEVTLFGRPDLRHPHSAGLVVAVDALYEEGPATSGPAASADLLLTGGGGSLKLEGLCDQKSPNTAPILSPGISDTIDRCGAYAEVGYLFARRPIQPVVRVEYSDDNLDLNDAGDVLLIDGGVNVQLIDSYARAQLHYLARIERYGASRDNDALVLSMSGAF